VKFEVYPQLNGQNIGEGKEFVGVWFKRWRQACRLSGRVNFYCGPSVNERGSSEKWGAKEKIRFF